MGLIISIMPFFFLFFSFLRKIIQDIVERKVYI